MHIKQIEKLKKTALALFDSGFLKVLSGNCGKRGHQTEGSRKNSTSDENNVDYASFEFFPSIID